MDLMLDNKTALVTGATAGIGLEIARRLAVEGASVFVTGRDEDKLDAAVESIIASGGKSVTGIVANAATVGGASAILENLPVVDILVNNLGIYETKDFEEITDDDWLHIFEVNVLSGVRLARAYFPAMIGQGWGRILFISSESSLNVPPDMIHYGMTKTAQLSVARGLAELTKGTAVTVNSVLPGPTRSEGIVDFLKSVSSEPAATPERQEAEFFRKDRPSSLIQRLIVPEEIASMVAFLASPLSAATNGAAIRAEGGLVRTIA